MIRWIVGALLLVAALGGIAAYALRPTPAQPIDFVDDLKGPASPHLVIPFDSYSLTPHGLLRSKALTGLAFGSDRVMVRTASGAYLDRDFIFEIDVMIPDGTQDLAYVGFGRGKANPAYENEPAGAFQFRIHNLPDVDRVDAAASLPPRGRPARPGGRVHAELVQIGRYVGGSTATFRIERAGRHVTLSIPSALGASHTFDLATHPDLFDRDEAYLFFGNTTEGTVFSNVRVRPRG